MDIDVYKRLGNDIAEKEQPDIKDLDSKLEQIEGKIKTVEQDEKKVLNLFLIFFEIHFDVL